MVLLLSGLIGDSFVFFDSAIWTALTSVEISGFGLGDLRIGLPNGVIRGAVDGCVIELSALISSEMEGGW